MTLRTLRGVKLARCKRVHTVRCHLWEIVDKAKVVNSDKVYHSSGAVSRLRWVCAYIH